jgi:hypothetical protein
MCVDHSLDAPGELLGHCRGCHTFGVRDVLLGMSEQCMAQDAYSALVEPFDHLVASEQECVDLATAGAWDPGAAPGVAIQRLQRFASGPPPRTVLQERSPLSIVHRDLTVSDPTSHVDCRPHRQPHQERGQHCIGPGRKGALKLIADGGFERLSRAECDIDLVKGSAEQALGSGTVG